MKKIIIKRRCFIVEVIENIDDLAKIKNDINRMADEFKMPLLRFEWLKNCAEAFCPPAKMQVFILKEDGIIKAIAPLALIKKLISDRLEILGTSVLKEPGGFLYADLDSLQKILKIILDLNKPVFINGIRTISPESSLLESIPDENKKHMFASSNVIPYLLLPGNWESFQKQISSDRRSSLRRLERIAREMGEYKIEIISPAKNYIDKYTDEIFSIEAAGWKSRIGTAMKSNSSLGKFFRGYLFDAAEAGFLRLCFLRINGEAIAVQIGIIHSNRFWLLKIGYNERWSKCSPGILLMNEMIRYIFENNLEAIELLGSDEQWLHIWTNQARELASYRIYPSSFSSILDLLPDYSGSFYNKVRSHLIKSYNNKSRRLSNVKV